MQIEIRTLEVWQHGGHTHCEFRAEAWSDFELLKHDATPCDAVARAVVIMDDSDELGHIGAFCTEHAQLIVGAIASGYDPDRSEKS